VKFFESQSTQCYVANNDKFAIVAFRGSEIWKNREDFDLNAVVADLKTNIDIRLINWEPGGKVHRGFKKALDEVWLDLLPHIRKLHGKGCKIWTTGHSLGAALATLFADRYGHIQGVYTFGSPRVGNGDFKDQVNARIYRIVNNNDIVPRVPPRGVYVHVGKLKFIDHDGIIQDILIGNEPAVNQPRDETYGREFADQPHNNSFEGFIPAPFRDHVPLLYAIHLWNNIIEGQR
jgi:predicted lipase